MADTTISAISAAIIRKGQPITRYSTLAANTYIPGDWGYYSATNTVTAIATGTAACKLLKPVLIGFEPRINASTKARLDIDDSYADQTTARVPVIWGGLNGPLLVAATCEDPAGALLKGVGMMASNTAGDIEQLDNGTDPTGGCIGPANIIVWRDQANGDTVGYFLYY